MGRSASGCPFRAEFLSSVFDLRLFFDRVGAWGTQLDPQALPLYAGSTGGWVGFAPLLTLWRLL
eukprot:scaffold131796_cov36-Prasinocladus_malaysianus.AAC.1